MKLLLVTVLAVAPAALAQTPPPLPQKGNNAINETGKKNSDTPVKGANSFTEDQAKSRMQAAGYEGISELKKSDDGVWRAKALRGRSRFEVSLDYQGNVNDRRLDSLPSE